jgi:shikimate kinase
MKKIVDKKENITLIGMSGVGKSTIGRILATQLGWEFIDTDRIMEQDAGKKIQSVLNEIGSEKFKQLESSKIIEMKNILETVFAPGGSIVYTDEAMNVLKEISTIIYLKYEIDSLLKFIDPAKRGIVDLKDRTYKEVFHEREPLYEKFADIIIDITGNTPKQSAKIIINQLK